ncbi:MAG TPA: hypothetical protein IAB20_12500 [Candidatus Pullichristensenella excrementipullorum]|nr:hypothetical protein [Candidatus Pullichristensenella excrementipullorum]
MRSSVASRIKLGIVLILVVLIAVLGMTGTLRIGKYRFYPFADFLQPGLDLGGGVSATYLPQNAVEQATPELLAGMESVLRARLDALELDEATLERYGDGLRIEAPASAYAEGDLSAIGATGELQVLDSSGYLVLTGDDLASPAVTTVYDADNNPYPAVSFRPSEEAVQSLASLSASETLSVYLDGELIATVGPSQLSENGTGFIPLTNYATAAEGARAAQRLAAILASGEMPLAAETTRLETISPLLGENAGTLVSVAALAALALALVALIARYRLPGAAAALGVCVWALLCVIFQCELSIATMSLSGVAGLLVGLMLVSAGFALLLERCCREARSYAPAAALRRAWRSALPVMADAGVAVLLAGLAMYFLGAGAVKNFAAAMFISVLCALAVLILLSRFFLGNGLKLSDKVFVPKANLTDRKAAFPKLRLIVPAALIVVALVMQLCGAGLRGGLDFGSGAVLRYALGEEFSLAEAADAAREAGVDALQVVKAEASAVEEAATDEAAADGEAVTDETAATDETATDEAATDETAATDEAAVTDETATDETAADDTATDETAADETAADETAVTDETAAADETTVSNETEADETAATDETVTDGTATDGTASAVAAGGMTDVEFRVLGADAASLEGAQEALLTALTSRYAGARFVSAQDVSAAGLPMAEVWAPLAGCLLAIVYLAIRFGLSSGAAALAACLLDMLTALAVCAIFGWALPVESSFPAAIALIAIISLLCGALTLSRYHEARRAPGNASLTAEQLVAENTRAVAGRAISATAPLLLAGVCMLILGPAGVRAMGLPLLAGALSILSTATGLTGRLLIALRARRGGK